MSKSHLYRTLQVASVAAMLAGSGAAFADTTATVTTDDNTPRSADLSTAMSDTAITAKVKAKFASDSRLKNTDISVVTANGVVNLTGSAPSMKVKRAATDLAKNVDGVVDVDNKLVTPAGAEISSMETKSKNAEDKTERVASDSWITTKVKAALIADHRTSGTEISVKTIHHVVHLTGNVGSQSEIDSAKEIAAGVKHVKKVDTSELKVASTS